MKTQSIFAVLLIVSSVFGWWDGGHMITVEVAKQEILARDPSLYQKIEKYITILNPLCDARSQTFVQAASWADDIKDPAMNFWDKWHFFNKPINEEGLYVVLDQDSLNNNSINALKRCVQELQKNNTNPINNHDNISVQQAIMMRYLIHIVGDMHQPLHNTNLFNYTFATSQGDLGGNKENVLLLNGTSMVLHFYFDSGALRLANFSRPLSQEQEQQVTDFAASFRAEYPRSFFNERINITLPEIWAQESYEIAVRNIYPYLKLTNQVTPEWDNLQYEMIKQQIAIGGYRLADLLTSVFNPPVPPTPAQNFNNSTSSNSTSSIKLLRKSNI
ncbi:hypothetical protein ABPG72_022528 [Tetrahymena utriculariae]